MRETAKLAALGEEDIIDAASSGAAAAAAAKAAPAPHQSYQFSSATAIILPEACRRQKSLGGYYRLISGQR